MPATAGCHLMTSSCTNIITSDAITGLNTDHNVEQAHRLPLDAKASNTKNATMCSVHMHRQVSATGASNPRKLESLQLLWHSLLLPGMQASCFENMATCWCCHSEAQHDFAI